MSLLSAIPIVSPKVGPLNVTFYKDGRRLSLTDKARFEVRTMLLSCRDSGRIHLVQELRETRWSKACLVVCSLIGVLSLLSGVVLTGKPLGFGDLLLPQLSLFYHN